MKILESANFYLQSRYNIIKDKSIFQLVLGQDMIIPIKNVADLRNMRQRKQAQT